MSSFFRFFIERHTFALVLTFMFILLGLMTLPSIKRDTFPNVDLDEGLDNTIRYFLKHK